jgi:hypothetical protein
MPEGRWLVWLSPEVVFTDTNRTIESVILNHLNENRYYPDIFVTTDSDSPELVDGHVFIIRNTPWTRQLLQTIDYNFGRISRDFTKALIPIEAMSPAVRKKIIHLDKAELARVYRYTHDKRQPSLFQRVLGITVEGYHADYSKDPEEIKWRSGDFMAEVIGMRYPQRVVILEYLLANCVDRHCDRGSEIGR